MADALDAVLQLRREKLAREQAASDAVGTGIQSGINNFINARNLQQNQRNSQLDALIEERKLSQTDRSLAQTDRSLDIKEKKAEKDDSLSLFKTASSVAEFAKLTGNAQLFAQAAAVGNSVVEDSLSGASSTNPNNFINSAANVIQGSTGSGITGISPDQKDAFGEQTNQSKKIQDVEKQVIAQSEKEKEKLTRGASEGLKEFRTFTLNYRDSLQELRSAIPEFDRVGIGGSIDRAVLSLGEKVGEFPVTSQMLAEIDSAANQVARTVEGGRVTDQDRAVYARTFANSLKASSAKNTRATANTIINRFHNKGGDILPLLQELSDSDIDVMQNVVTETIRLLTKKDREDLLKKLGG